MVSRINSPPITPTGTSVCQERETHIDHVHRIEFRIERVLHYADKATFQTSGPIGSPRVKKSYKGQK